MIKLIVIAAVFIKNNIADNGKLAAMQITHN